MTLVDIVLIALLAVVTILCLIILLRPRAGADAGLREAVDGLALRMGELQGVAGAGITGLREEVGSGGRLAREELAASINQLADLIAKQVSNGRIESQTEAKALREELTGSFAGLGRTLSDRMGEATHAQTGRLDGFATQLAEHRRGAGEDALALRREVGGTLTTLGQGLSERLDVVARTLKEADEASRTTQEGLRTALTTSVREMGEANERRQEALRQTVEGRLDQLRTDNAAKLEEMRATVDEKLQGTLEARLGASFTTVNENLERVFKSVGEMQQIATGVGDLKRVLSNVKLRGNYGETTLAMLLEQVMTPDQYGTNVEVKPGSGARVEFAVKLPGDGDTPIWLPIDVKLPKEDYERLIDASERADPAAVEEATRGLERTIRKCGADIRDKYVDPPHSTDFGIMFLPTEGLFAEVTRRPGLIETLQRECRVIVAGPTTLMATLVSLRMGFRSLAIQQRSSEVWQVLGAVKSEFGKFGDVLDKVHKKLGEAQTAVESAGTRRRAMDRKLRAVEALPEAAARDLLAIAADDLTEDLNEEID